MRTVPVEAISGVEFIIHTFPGQLERCLALFSLHTHAALRKRAPFWLYLIFFCFSWVKSAARVPDARFQGSTPITRHTGDQRGIDDSRLSTDSVTAAADLGADL